MPAYHTSADTPRPPKLLERMRIHLRTRHYSIRTEEAYIDWARRFMEPLHKSSTHVLAHACRVRQHPGLCSNLILA